MERYRVNNLLTWAFSKRLILASHSNSKSIALHRDNDFDEEMSEYSIPFGISDAAKLNKNYTEFIKQLSISSFSNYEALHRIISIWSDNNKRNIDRSNLKFLEDKANIKIEENQANFLDIESEVIEMWTTKLPVSSIAFKLNLSPIFVFNTIHNCKSLVRKNIWANIVKKNKKM